MYLSRLFLNPRSRAVRHDLHDCNELKRSVMRAFPQSEANDTGARDQFGVLYRQDIDHRSGVSTLIIQSRAEPDWHKLQERDVGYLLTEPECKNVVTLYDQLEAGQELRFRLRANPTRRLARGNNHKLAGKRVDLRTDEERLEWLQQKTGQSGFSLVDVRMIPDMSAVTEVYGLPPSRPESVSDSRAAPAPKVIGRSSQKKTLTFGAAVFDGYLRITDLSLFRAALEHGIGPAKAYGFGLLSIAPVR